MSELEIRQLIDAALDASYEWEDAKDEESESERNAKRAAYRTAYDNLLSAVASLSKDRDRLNWLEGISNCVVTIDGRDHYLGDTKTTIRDAIDQAMQVSAVSDQGSGEKP